MADIPPSLVTNMKKGILQRMATLFDERAMVSCLKELEHDTVEYESQSAKKAFGSENVELWGDKHISENDACELFIDYKDRWYCFHSSKWRKLSYSGKLHEARRILTACREDGFVALESEDDALEGIRKWKVTETDGDNLLDFINFYLRYVPQRFPEPTRIVVSVLISVITAALTSSVIFLWLLDGF